MLIEIDERYWQRLKAAYDEYQSVSEQYHSAIGEGNALTDNGIDLQRQVQHSAIKVAVTLHLDEMRLVAAKQDTPDEVVEQVIAQVERGAQVYNLWRKTFFDGAQYDVLRLGEQP